MNDINYWDLGALVLNQSSIIEEMRQLSVPTQPLLRAFSNPNVCIPGHYHKRFINKL